MSKLLVLVEDYPDNDGKVSLMYVHTRNKYYKENCFDVTVLNFRAKQNYVIDNVKVITLDSYKQDNDTYDVRILHAANLKHHYLFLKKYSKIFSKLIFFYHGHEVLKINKVYPTPYKYQKRNLIKVLFQNLYDDFKFHIWRKYLNKVKEKSSFVFVSNWMKNEFIKWIRPKKDLLEGRSYITYNCVDKVFESNFYDYKSEKKYDFITIRSFLDGSKYCIDVVNDLAKNNPGFKFLIVGKGEFFNHNIKAENVDWLNTSLNHDEIIKYLNLSRFALMPTRTDAQGLMMCEMAAFGIPVITSDIPVCHEVFDEADNVYFIKNNALESLDFTRNLKLEYKKDSRFYLENTIKKEMELITSLIK